MIRSSTATTLRLASHTDVALAGAPGDVSLPVERTGDTGCCHGRGGECVQQDTANTVDLQIIDRQLAECFRASQGLAA